MVHPSELWKRDSSNSTTTVSSFRSSLKSSRGSAGGEMEAVNSNGAMAGAAAYARGRRYGTLKNSTSHPSIRSINSTSSSNADSIRAAKKGRSSTDGGRPDLPSRNSLGNYVGRAREVTRSHRVDSSASKRSYASSSPKQKRRSAETVMQSGRHGNEWLFGGWSLRETVKGLLK